MKITTLTLNPAFDIHISLPAFTPGREHLAESRTSDVGGKGINNSRALIAAGIDCDTLVVLGNENADDFSRGLEAVGIRAIELRQSGRIRENITLHYPEGETRISFRGFEAEPGLLDRVHAAIDAGLVTFTGSLPAGITEAEAEAFLASLARDGIRLVIDSKSIPPQTLRRLRPWLIKPNGEEIAAYLGYTPDEAGLLGAAAEWHRDGIANVLISLGGDGAVLAAEGRLFRAHAPKIDAVSTIGAGDSMIAGFIAAADLPPGERLANAIAFGTAACLREGTAPPLINDIKRIRESVIINEVAI